MATTNNQLALQAAFSMFTTDEMPIHWDAMEELEQDAWLTAHRWQPLEHLSNDELSDLIDHGAETVERAINLALLSAQ